MMAEVLRYLNIINSKIKNMLTNENILQTEQAVAQEKNNLGSETEVLQSNYLPGGDESDDDEQEDDFDESDEDTEDDNVSELNEQDLDLDEDIPPLDENDLEENDLTAEEADDIEWETEDEDDDEEEELSE
jgi:hypothetical protein